MTKKQKSWWDKKRRQTLKNSKGHCETCGQIARLITQQNGRWESICHDCFSILKEDECFSNDPLSKEFREIIRYFF